MVKCESDPRTEASVPSGGKRITFHLREPPSIFITVFLVFADIAAITLAVKFSTVPNYRGS